MAHEVTKDDSSDVHLLLPRSARAVSTTVEATIKQKIVAST
jgi:hypothetical protein